MWKIINAAQVLRRGGALVLFAAACTLGCAVPPESSARSTTPASTRKPAAPDWWNGTITFTNSTKWNIHKIFLTPYDHESWGPDQLRGQALLSGEQVTLTDVDCDKYDVKVVDEDGDECVIEDVDLCLEDLAWEISSQDLLHCEGAN